MNRVHSLYISSDGLLSTEVNRFCRANNLNPISISVCWDGYGYKVVFIAEDMDEKGASE